MKKIKSTISCLMAVMICLINFVTPVYAEEKWPEMPQVEAPSICVMEITTGTILYERDMDEQNYPASITKRSLPFQRKPCTAMKAIPLISAAILARK